MKCLHCGTELIHGGDHDGEERDDYDIVSNLSCPNCDTHVYVYHAFEKETNEKQLWIDGYKEWLDKKEEPEMWEHYCDEEKSMMAVGKGEPCNWCGKEEHESHT
jgi:DNA-directed RNA polymerase subunit RPC12/RpoP|tara:strand:- start:182 stop:493 length:312 start_codon:yes stop_codon:yes gene_type:complete